MHKVSQLVITTSRHGLVGYGVPRHVPMRGWSDFDCITVSEVDFEDKTQEEFELETIRKNYPNIQKELESEKPGSTHHEPDCPCGFCKAGFTYKMRK